MLPLLALVASLAGQAHAAPPISSGFSVLAGVGATFDGDPATLMLQAQGELPLYPDDQVGVGLVLPLELTTSGDERFGASTNNTMFTFVPSVRVRALNSLPVRFYGDAGLGIAYITATSHGWFMDQTTHRTGWATRFVLGLEVGPPKGGVAFVFEPLGIDTLNFDDRHDVGYVARLGVGVRY